MWNRENRQSVFPVMVILTVGFLCFWASHSMAQSLADVEVQTQIHGQVAELEAKCDRNRHLKNNELNDLLRKEIDMPCDREGGKNCKPKRIRFGNQTFEAQATGPKLDCGSYVTKFRSLVGQPLSRQQLIDEILGYPCQNLHTRQDPNTLYNACNYKAANREELDPSTIQEILAARNQLAGNITGNVTTGNVTRGRAISGKLEKSENRPATGAPASLEATGQPSSSGALPN